MDQVNGGKWVTNGEAGIGSGVHSRSGGCFRREVVIRWWAFLLFTWHRHDGG